MKSSNGSLKTSFNNKRRRFHLGQPFYLLCILTLLALIAYPLGAVLLQSVFPNLFDQGFYPFSLQSFVSMFTETYTYQSIVNAFLFGFGSALIAAVLGIFFAVLIHRQWIYTQRLVGLVIWLIFFTPSYLVAEGWVLLMQDKGIICQLLHLPDGTTAWFFSPIGLIAAMAFRLFPVVYISVRAGLNGLGSDYEDAARTVGSSSFFLWIRIVIPLLFPAILAGSTLTFAESASDFGFAAVFAPQAHIPMLTYSIYTALSQMPVNYSQVGALSIVLIGIIAVALWSQKWILGRGNYSTIKNQIRPYRVNHKRSIVLSAAAHLILIIVFALPIVAETLTSFLKYSNAGFTLSNWTFAHYRTVLQGGSDSLASLLRSFAMASSTAVIVAFLGIGLAFLINNKAGFQTRFLYVLTMSTLAIPGIVLAAGYIFGWNATYLVPLHLNFYGTLFCLFLAYIAGALPNSIRLQMAALTQISPSLLHAGQVLGANLFTIFRKVILPLIATTTISTLFLIFSHTMFELPSSELLHPPGQNVLPVVITNYYNNLEVENGAAITVMATVFVLLIYGLGQYAIFLVKKIQQKKFSRSVTVRPLTNRERPIKGTEGEHFE